MATLTEPLTREDLRALMTEHKVSEGQLAHFLGVHISTVKKWRSGKHDVTRIQSIAIKECMRQAMARTRGTPTADRSDHLPGV